MNKKDNKNGLVTKDLSQLGTLLKEAQKPQQVSMETKRPSAVIQLSPDDDVLDSIWTVMSDHKGRTVNEIERVFDMHLIPTEDVLTLVRYLHNIGCLNTTGRPENPIYTLKKGATMPCNQEQTSFRPRRTISLAAPVSEWDPESKVDPEEGLDCCIWKLTRDRKPRTIIEIGELGHAYGFAREVVRNRVIALANKSWYDRNGKSTVTYAMKKGIKMPTPDNAKTRELDTGIKINSTTTQHSWQHKDRKIDYTNISNGMPTASQSKPIQEEVMQQPSTASQPQANSVKEDLVVRKGDDWDLAIWKTMRDYKEYTAAEVGILLSDFGFNPASTATRISTLYLKQHWFDRSNIPGSRAYKYRLKDGTTRPESHGHNVATAGKDEQSVKQDELPNLDLVPQGKDKVQDIIQTKYDPSQIQGGAKEYLAGIDSNQKSAAGTKPFVSPEIHDLAKQIAADMDLGKNPTPVVEKQPEQPSKEIMNQTSPTIPVVETKATPQLGGGKYLKFVIQIKSISMTVEEGRKLYARLKESGYGKARVVPVCDTNDTLFGQTITIKGTVFPASQVQEIALELEEFGFGEDENFES